MHLANAIKLGFYTKKINVRVQKIHGSYLDILRMIIIDCLVKNKLKRVWFFQEIFLLTNISLEILLGMLFFTFSSANILFSKREFV